MKRGGKMSEAQKEKIRLSNLGQKRSTETRERIKQVSLELWRSEGFRKKFSKARKGYKASEEHKTRIGFGVSTSPKWRAAMQSKEFREKMRLCHLGDTNPSKRPEVRQKILTYLQRSAITV